MSQVLAGCNWPYSSVMYLLLYDPRVSILLLSFRFQKLFLLRNIDRGVIDLKVNCGLYLRVVFEHAVRICHIKWYVFAFGFRALFFLCGRLLALVVGSWAIAYSEASPLLLRGLEGARQGVAAHAPSTPGLPAQDCVLVCWGRRFDLRGRRERLEAACAPWRGCA